MGVAHYPAPQIHSPKSLPILPKIASYLNESQFLLQFQNYFSRQLSENLLILPFSRQFLRLLPQGKPVRPFTHSSTFSVKMQQSSNPSLSRPSSFQSRITSGLCAWNCEEIFLSFPQMTILKICLLTSWEGRLRICCSRRGRSIPLSKLAFSQLGPSMITLERQMGVKIEKRAFPCIPRILPIPIKSEQLNTADLFSNGRSSLPGLVRRTSCWYLRSGQFCCERKARGLAPEKDSFSWLIQQSPQKTSEQYSHTSYYFFSANFFFFSDQSKYLLELFTSSNRNRLIPLRASISPCISCNRSLQLPQLTTDRGRLLVPSPIAANQNVCSLGLTMAIDDRTMKREGQQSFLNFLRYAVWKRLQVASLIARARVTDEEGVDSCIKIKEYSTIDMEIRLTMPLQPSRPSLDRVLSPSNICLQSHKEDPQRSKRNPSLTPSPPPPPFLSPPPQTNNPQYRFNHEGANTSLQIVTTPKRREARIFSLVHSAQREHSGNHSTNSSSFKEPRPGLSLVSKDRKSIERSASSAKKKPEEISMGTLESFLETSSSLTLGLQQKENKKLTPAIMIKQPTLLKAHPLRSGKMNGSCMGKLIVQRALQERMQNFAHPRANIQQANSRA